MFAGFSLVKKFENVQLLNNNSRVIYAADFECFAVCFTKSRIFYGSGGNSGLYSQSHAVNYFLIPSGIFGSIQSSIGHLRNGGNLFWIGGSIGYVADVYIYRAV